MNAKIVKNTSDMNGQSKVRDSNLELFRIISMILIVAHHYVVNSGLTDVDGPLYASPISFVSLFLLLFGAWGKIGINCFMMITGYFMCKSQITLKKFCKLLFEIQFYRIVIYFIFLISGYSTFSTKSLILVLIPVSQIGLNFSSCFIIFWLFIPFLNILVNSINERLHIMLILLSSFLYIAFGTVHLVTFNYVSWFIVLYFIASYIRLYPKKIFANSKLWGVLMFAFIFISALSVVAGTWLRMRFNKNLSYFFVTDSNTFLAVVVGVCSFLFFKNIKVRNNKVINTIAASTFGVLLIHANSDTMRQWLWKDLLDVVGHYTSSLMPLYAICCVLAIFVVCILIDIIRICFIEKPFFRWWDKHEESFVAKYKRIESIIFKKFNIE